MPGEGLGHQRVILLRQGSAFTFPSGGGHLLPLQSGLLGKLLYKKHSGPADLIEF